MFVLLNEIGIINQLSTAEFERQAPYDLTVAQFTVLNHCVRLGDNRTPAELASAFQVSRGTLTSTLGRLEAKGFISIVPDAKDGRSKRVLLTKAGRKAREESIGTLAPRLTRMQAALSRREVEAILPKLQSIRKWLDENRSG